jgi:hypothetical protein
MIEQTNLSYYLKLIAALAVVLSLVLLSRLVFDKYLGGNYLSWYIDAGPFIGLATGVFSAAWGNIDRNSGLVSSNPLNYCGACLQLLGLPFEVFGSQRTKDISIVDRLVAIPMMVVFTLSALAWLVFIAPMQYFVFLLCGAPSRIALEANGKLYAKFDGTQLRFKHVSAETTTTAGEWDASMKDKPVTLASGFSAAMFFGLGYVPFIQELL